MATPDIKVGSTFDARGFKKAETALAKFEKRVLAYGKSFGIAFSAESVTRFGVSLVKAFAQEERQIASLTATVKALGLGFRSTDVNTFIEDLERLTGITREQLQPAFQKLLTQTGSITKSQQILSAAVKVSMSGLMSTEEAATALTQAYVGNVKGLKQFNLGLTNAQLAGMTFDQILKKISATYDTQFNEALNTTQVKIDKFNVAIGNAKENIGSGLVDAFSKLAGSGDLDAANTKIEKFSMSLADILRNWNLLSTAKFVGTGGIAAIVEAIAGASQPTKKTGGGIAFGKRISPQQIIKERKAERDAAARLLKIEQDKAAALKKQTEQKKLQAAIDKAQIALGAASNVFDLERIQVAAAEQNKTLTDNERMRLSIKEAEFALQDAIDSKDTARIEKQTAILNGLVGQFGVMQKQSVALTDIKGLLDSLGVNKDLINLMNLKEAYDLLLKMQGIKIVPMVTPTTATTASVVNKLTSFSGTTASAFNSLSTAEKDALGGYVPFVGSNVPSVNPLTYGGSGVGLGNNGTGLQVPPTVIVQITDNAQKLVDAVTFATQNNSANGTPVALNRNATNLAW